MVSYTAIETQVVFEMLLMLITGQLAIAGQLGREVYLWSVSWERGTEMTWRKSSWQMKALEMDLPCSGRPWQGWR